MAAVAVTAATRPSLAEQQPWRAAATAPQTERQPGVIAQSQADRQHAGLSQPRTPRPTQALEPQAAAQPRPPFVLTPREQQYIDRLLSAWEAKNRSIKTFSASVRRYKYDTVFGPKDGKAMQVDTGSVKYQRPDKGLFRIDGDRPEQWVCNGESVFQYEYKERVLKEYQLPPESRGKAIEDGPLPFIFTANADKLRRRFWLKAVEPPSGAADQYWLVAYPRHQQDAANFKLVEIALGSKDLLPVGIQLYSTSYDGRTNLNRVSYAFDDIVINDPLGFLKGDPFAARTPFGWKKVVEQPPGRAAQVGASPGAADRR